MNIKNMWCGLVFVLLIAAVTPLHAWGRGDSVSDTNKAKAVLKDLMERSRAYADVEFVDTPGERGIKGREVLGDSGERHDTPMFISFISIVSVDYYYATSGYGLRWFAYNSKHPTEPVYFFSSNLSKSDVQAGARALRLLAAGAQREADALDAAKFEQFQEQAKAWRSLQVKPDMPEEARRHKLVAENSVKEKNFDKAQEEYDAALKTFPTWSEGQFNLALIAGENQGYRTAILHMKCYLELEPGASDAQAARDKIVIWQDKIRTNLAE